MLFRSPCEFNKSPRGSKTTEHEPCDLPLTVACVTDKRNAGLSTLYDQRHEKEKQFRKGISHIPPPRVKLKGPWGTGAVQTAIISQRYSPEMGDVTVSTSRTVPISVGSKDTDRRTSSPSQPFAAVSTERIFCSEKISDSLVEFKLKLSYSVFIIP